MNELALTVTLNNDNAFGNLTKEQTIMIFQTFKDAKYNKCLMNMRNKYITYGIYNNMHSAIMFNNTMISCNLLEASRECGVKKFFFASSACVYPEYKQSWTDLDQGLKEIDAWPAQPQDAYGLEKLYTEELCKHYANDYNIKVRIARFHNIYGPMGTWKGGREKAPAALCRKIAVVNDINNYIEVWGDGLQTRSFMYVDDCIDGIMKLVESDVDVPVNLGSDRMVSINELADIIKNISAKSFDIKHVPGPMGVRGRNSNNDYVKEVLGWKPKVSLEQGLAMTYKWICSQIAMANDVADFAYSKTYQIEHNIPLGALP